MWRFLFIFLAIHSGDSRHRREQHDNSQWLTNPQKGPVNAVDRMISASITLKNAKLCVNRTCGICLAGTYMPDNCSCCMNDGYCPSSSSGTLCQPCQPGSYTEKKGQKDCSRCERGSFMNATGAIKCNKCPPGTFCDKPGCTECTSCPAGTEAPASGSEKCKLCPMGTMKPHGGPGSCIRCRKGAYNIVDGSTSCSDCPAGFFCENQWQEPIECPENTICPVGSHKPTECKPPLFSKHGYHCYLSDPIIALIVSSIIFSTLGGMFAIARYYVRQTRRYSVNQETASLVQAHNNSQMNSTLSGF